MTMSLLCYIFIRKVGHNVQWLIWSLFYRKGVRQGSVLESLFCSEPFAFPYFLTGCVLVKHVSADILLFGRFHLHYLLVAKLLSLRRVFRKFSIFLTYLRQELSSSKTQCVIVNNLRVRLVECFFVDRYINKYDRWN